MHLFKHIADKLRNAIKELFTLEEVEVYVVKEGGRERYYYKKIHKQHE